MKKSISIMALLLSLGLLLSAAPPAWAEPDVSGAWRGAWSCTEYPCPKKTNGKISANMEQSLSGHLKGTYTVDGTPKGVLRCTIVTGVVSSDSVFGADLKVRLPRHLAERRGPWQTSSRGQYDGTQAGMSKGNFKLARWRIARAGADYDLTAQ